MDGFRIEVEPGDFPLVASNVDAVADEVDGASPGGALSGSTDAIPGSTSAAMIGPTGDAIDGRLDDAVTALRQTSQGATDAQTSFTAMDAGLAEAFTPSSSPEGLAHMAERLG